MKNITDLNQSVELFTIRKMALAMYRIMSVGSFDIIYKDSDMTDEEKKIVVYKMETRTLAYVKKVTGISWDDLKSIKHMSQEHCQQLVLALAPVTAEDIRSWWHTDGRDEFYATREEEKEIDRMKQLACIFRVNDKGFVKFNTDGKGNYSYKIVQTPAEATGYDVLTNNIKDVEEALNSMFDTVKTITMNKQHIVHIITGEA